MLKCRLRAGTVELFVGLRDCVLLETLIEWVLCGRQRSNVPIVKFVQLFIDINGVQRIIAHRLVLFFFLAT